MPIVVPACVSSSGRIAVGSSDPGAPGAVRGRSILARPKSRTFAWPRAFRKMLAGLRSRWTMPFACADSSASASWMPVASTASTSSAPRWTRAASVSPSSSSIAMKCWPSCWPTSYTVQMPGWLSAEAAFASRWKRSSEGVS